MQINRFKFSNYTYKRILKAEQKVVELDLVSRTTSLVHNSPDIEAVQLALPKSKTINLTNRRSIVCSKQW